MGIRVFLLTLVIFFMPHALHAQFGGVEPLEISMSPEYPRPFQTVTVRPSSTLIDLTASKVTVSVNGTVVSEGSGSAPVNVRIGGPGTLTTIRVTAVNNGKTYTRELRVRPAEVSLVLEPQSSSHPFYEGGVGVASEGLLRLVALPDFRSANGTRIDPATLVYTWRLGDRVLEAHSGIGKSYLSATAPVRYRDTVVSVTVTTQDSAIVGKAQVVVAPIDPLVRIYRSDPLLGPLFNTALTGTVALGGEEQTFRAVPYHFPGNSGLTWLVNGAESGSDKNITLRATGSGGGVASLVAKVKEASTFALGEARLSVQFGEARSGLGIFGL